MTTVNLMAGGLRGNVAFDALRHTPLERGNDR